MEPMQDSENCSGNARTINGKRIEQVYQKKTQLEHILLRPDTYIGSIERSINEIWVYDEDSSKILRRGTSYVPGLIKIFDEIIVNAADNKQRDPDMSMLKVTIDPDSGSISIWNNGRGIPIETHSEHHCYIPELIFGQLLTGSNFDDDQKKTTGGRNGFGAKLANIFSTEFIIETADQTVGKQYKQIFRSNMSQKDKPIIKAYSGQDFTCISFKPDWNRFKMDGLEDDTLALFKKRVYDIAACMSTYGGKRVKVYLNGSVLQVTSFKAYLAMYDGIEDIVAEERVNGWDVAISPSDGQFQQVSFVNAICTVKGGQHVNHICEQVVSHLMKVLKRKAKGTEIKPHHIRNHLFVCVNALVENPAFDSQCKEYLNTKANAFGGSEIKLSEKMLKTIEKSAIVDAILSFSRFQATKELTKKSGKKTNKLTGIPKLDDANMAGTSKSQDCTLILTEGDSAKTLAVSGLGIVGRDYYGVFPLKGKLLNVRDSTAHAVGSNEEISKIVKILGLKFGTDYGDTKTLRYGHLMIMTDQDHDGSHIKGLLINFIHHFWPSLLKVDGFLLEFITPIVKCVKGKRELSFFTIPEYETWRSETGGRGWTIKYYKGLGTSTSKEAKEYFAEIDSHQIPFEWRDNERDADLIDLAFSKRRAEDRKEWLRGFEPGTYVDYGVDSMSYDDFINREFVLFSIEDNKRSLPCMIDGFKPSQRKVLYSCFKRKLKNEIKVAQLAGYVSEHSAYHHGEVSLTGTIVNMAQNYCGANNVALLYPGGQFGTRLMSGKDAASPRYIFTRLDKVTRTIFHPDDDAILNYLEDDGMGIEPSFYVPVIPMILVNGAEGIGTGWSTTVPNYSPRDIIENLRRQIRGERMVEMQPWYRGFVGNIKRKAGVAGKGSFSVEGIIERTSEDTVQITELPVKRSTTDYKTFLESLLLGYEPKEKKNDATKGKAKPKPKKKTAIEGNDEENGDEKKKSPTGAKFLIKDFRENHTDTTVHFTVTMASEDLDALEAQPGGLLKFFKLETTFSETNLTLFDESGLIARYHNPLQIMMEYFELRVKYYAKRKDHLLSRLQKEWVRLDNKVRFILAVVQGKLEVRNRKKDDLLAQLKKDGYDPIMPETSTKNSKHTEEDENGMEESGEEASPVAKGYDYLLGMNLWTLTKEMVEKLRNELELKSTELENLKATSLDELWLRDLDSVSQALDECDEVFAENRKTESKQRKTAGNGKGKGKLAKRPHKQNADLTDEDDYQSSTPKKRQNKNKGKVAPMGPPPPTPEVHQRLTETVIEGGITVSTSFAESLSKGIFVDILTRSEMQSEKAKIDCGEEKDDKMDRNVDESSPEIEEIDISDNESVNFSREKKDEPDLPVPTIQTRKLAPMNYKLNSSEGSSNSDNDFECARKEPIENDAAIGSLRARLEQKKILALKQAPPAKKLTQSKIHLEKLANVDISDGSDDEQKPAPKKSKVPTKAPPANKTDRMQARKNLKIDKSSTENDGFDFDFKEDEVPQDVLKPKVIRKKPVVPSKALPAKKTKPAQVRKTNKMDSESNESEDFELDSDASESSIQVARKDKEVTKKRAASSKLPPAKKMKPAPTKKTTQMDSSGSDSDEDVSISASPIVRQRTGRSRAPVSYVDLDLSE